MRPRLLAAAGFLAAAVSLVGCSGEEKLYNVSGTVTYNGKPIPKGLIFFDPDSSKGTTGSQGYASIENGKFSTADAGMGKGVRPGYYTIRVGGFDGKVVPESPFGNALFPEYTTAKEFPAADSTYDVDVPKRK